MPLLISTIMNVTASPSAHHLTKREKFLSEFPYMASSEYNLTSSTPSPHAWEHVLPRSGLMPWDYGRFHVSPSHP